MEESGHKLIDALKTHVLETMSGIPECAVGGNGTTGRSIEELAGLGLDLPSQNGWLTWSILMSLVDDGKVEVLRPGRGMKWRLIVNS